MKTKIFKIIKKIAPFALVIGLMWFLFVRPNNKTLPVKKIDLTNRIIERTVSASGQIESESQSILSFNTIGKIANINVKEGDVVKKGQLLAYLNSSTQSETAQTYKDARDIILRDIEYFEYNKESNIDSLGSETEYDMTLRKYKEQLSQAEASYQAQLSILNNYYIYAPFDGTIVSISKEIGETATTGEAVIVLADVDNLVFKISLDQEDYGYLEENQDAEIELDAYDKHVFTGFVSEPPLYVNASSDSFDVDIKITSNGKPIRLGMQGDAHIILARTETEVPSLTYGDFYYDSENNPYVWTTENGLLKKQPIEFGLEGDLYYEVLTPNLDNILMPLNRNITLEEGYQAKVVGE